MLYPDSQNRGIIFAYFDHTRCPAGWARSQFGTSDCAHRYASKNRPAGRARFQCETSDCANRNASKNRPVRYPGGFHRYICRTSIRRAETSDHSGCFTRVSSSTIRQTRGDTGGSPDAERILAIGRAVLLAYHQIQSVRLEVPAGAPPLTAGIRIRNRRCPRCRRRQCPWPPDGQTDHCGAESDRNSSGPRNRRS